MLFCKLLLLIIGLGCFLYDCCDVLSLAFPMFIAILPLLHFWIFFVWCLLGALPDCMTFVAVFAVAFLALSPLPMVMEVNGRRRKTYVGMCVESGTEHINAKCQKKGVGEGLGNVFRICCLLCMLGNN
jgi:hypothetical protein